MATYLQSVWNWLSAPTQAPQTRPTPEQFYTRRPQVKREFMRGPNEREISWEAQFALPASNPVLDVMSHGMEAGSVGDVGGEGVGGAGALRAIKGRNVRANSTDFELHPPHVNYLSTSAAHCLGVPGI